MRQLSLLESLPTACLSSGLREKLIPGAANLLHPAMCLPKGVALGQTLTINLLTTWGDPHFIGLTGIEIFDDLGACVSDPQTNPYVRISADPESVNVLPGYHDDPRTVGNLLDGVNHTCEDYHMWLAPFSEGRAHYVHIDFGRPAAVTMLRFWNYNKSRIHSFRGARLVEILVGEKLVFRGDIQKAPGHIEDPNGFAERVFIDDMKCIFVPSESCDSVKEVVKCDERQPSSDSPQFASVAKLRRQNSDQPNLGTSTVQGNVSAVHPTLHLKSEPVIGERPSTAVQSRTMGDSPVGSPALDAELSPTEPQLPKGRIVTITILNTWGDLYFTGLTSLQVLNQFQQPYRLTPVMLSACPKDVTVLPGHEADDRVLANLVDGHNVTTNRGCMWLVPLLVEGSPQLQIQFPRQVKVSGIRVWNYNSGPECFLCGAKHIQVAIDGRNMAPDTGFLLQRAPGHSGFDFGQTFFFVATPASQ
eukprot:EG_transcript_2270